MVLRADGPPGRWNKKKQEAEEGRKPMKKLQSSAWQAAGQEAGAEAGAGAPVRYIYFPLEIISIEHYCPNQISIQK